jgi:hypothetical protein
MAAVTTVVVMREASNEEGEGGKAIEMMCVCVSGLRLQMGYCNA